MKDKKQDEKALEELVKTADSYRAFFANLADELSKVLADIKAPEKEEDTWEMKCPYEVGDKYYIVNPKGSVKFVFWNGCVSNEKTFNQGHIFPTKQAAELEAKRRNLLTRFRAFRDECNGDWKVDWRSHLDRKYYILCGVKEIRVSYVGTNNDFCLFGYFKNEEDCERALELFGDEIKELFVDCEG